MATSIVGWWARQCWGGTGLLSKDKAKTDTPGKKDKFLTLSAKSVRAFFTLFRPRFS